MGLRTESEQALNTESAWALGAVRRGGRTIHRGDGLVTALVVFFVIVTTFWTLRRVEEVEVGRYYSSQPLAGVRIS